MGRAGLEPATNGLPICRFRYLPIVARFQLQDNEFGCPPSPVATGRFWTILGHWRQINGGHIERSVRSLTGAEGVTTSLGRATCRKTESASRSAASSPGPRDPRPSPQEGREPTAGNRPPRCRGPPWGRGRPPHRGPRRRESPAWTSPRPRDEPAARNPRPRTSPSGHRS